MANALMQWFQGFLAKDLSPVSAGRGWFPLFIRESFPGAWQRNIRVDFNSVLAFHAVFACQTLIASDIAKLRIKLVSKGASGVWSEVKNPAYDPVLRRPNSMQNRIQFKESWVLSKLIRGNTYVLKGRDSRGVVDRLWVLDPTRVMPLIADDGSVFYQLNADNVIGLEQDITVPAREIIHDRFNCIFHPLIGTSPIFANGLAAMQGLAIQNNSAGFFQNKSMPGGILTAPGNISNDTAARLKASWEANYSGENMGRLAVLGDGLKFEPIVMSATDSQLIEQLKWTAEVVCSTYHVPPYKIGVGAMPTYNNIQSLNVEYYSQCLQRLIEDIELCLDEGLEMKEGLGTEFDLDGLLRMDSVTQFEVLEKAKSVMTLDERRKKIDLESLTGGNTVYLQQQDHSLEAIAARDRLLIEQSQAAIAAASTPVAPPEEPKEPAAPSVRTLFVKAKCAGVYQKAA